MGKSGSENDLLPIRINEIFRSMQGEGTRAGEPVTFIRTTGCNLRCDWCDTTYSYTEGTEMTIKEIVKKVKELGIESVCVTGGEPLTQANAYELFEALVHAGCEDLYVETNGTILIDNESAVDSFIVDYKLPSSKPLKPFNEDNFKEMMFTDELKFVIADRNDYEIAKNVAKKVLSQEFPPKVLFSPCWVDGMVQQLWKWMVEDKEELKGVRYSLQIHKVAFDVNKRGV